MSLEPSRLADFRLAGALGAGATARVFDAVHVATGRPVAIKMLEPSARGSELRERFAREALFLANVTSHHVSRILGYGFDQGSPFLVLERLVGETLDAKLRRDGPVPAALAYEWIEQLLIGVRDIHAANVVHRDLKPANIFIQREGPREMVKVIDFGVARLVEAADDGSQGLTSASHLIGSVGYMAPEQFMSASKVGPAADLYALGVVIFRMITGQLPFVSKHIEAVIRMKREKDAPLLSSRPGAPSHSQLDWFVSKALSRDLSQRFQSSREALDMWVRIRPSFEGDEEEMRTSVDRPRSYDISAPANPSAPNAPSVGGTSPVPGPIPGGAPGAIPAAIPAAIGVTPDGVPRAVPHPIPVRGPTSGSPSAPSVPAASAPNLSAASVPFPLLPHPGTRGPVPTPFGPPPQAHAAQGFQRNQAAHAGALPAPGPAASGGPAGSSSGDPTAPTGEAAGTLDMGRISTAREPGPPMTMLSPGQAARTGITPPDPYDPRDIAPQSRTGVDFEIPARHSFQVTFDEVPSSSVPESSTSESPSFGTSAAPKIASDDDWEAVTVKRKVPDIIRIEREAKAARNAAEDPKKDKP